MFPHIITQSCKYKKILKNKDQFFNKYSKYWYSKPYDNCIIKSLQYLYYKNIFYFELSSMILHEMLVWPYLIDGDREAKMTDCIFNEKCVYQVINPNSQEFVTIFLTSDLYKT